MNNKLIGSAIALTLGSTVSFNACAALASNAILSFTSGNCRGMTCTYDSYGSPTSGPVTGGSYFGLDADGSNTITYAERSPMTLLNGVYINATQPAYAVHDGYPDATYFGSIDAPSSFYAVTGMHYTTSPVSILSDDGTGHVTLDFSGWEMYWNGSYLFLGSNIPTRPNQANLICGTDCSLGDTFLLDYAFIAGSGAIVGIMYSVHLEGVIGAVPVPAAAWLFGSGLIGLAGVAQRRKTV